MCWPFVQGPIIGDIEVEERRPRYHNEPRRKRLKFVRDRSVRRSDEWDLTRYSRTERQQWPEMWEQPQQWQQQPQYYPQHDQMHPAPQQPRIQHGQPLPPPLHIHQQPPQQRLHQGPHGDHDNHMGNGIQEIEEFRPNNPDERHVQHRDGNLEPHIINVEPRAPMPNTVRVHIDNRSRSRGRRRGSVYSADSSSNGQGRRHAWDFDNRDSFADLTHVRRASRPRYR